MIKNIKHKDLSFANMAVFYSFQTTYFILYSDHTFSYISLFLFLFFP
jgi:hypothetical protein